MDSCNDYPVHAIPGEEIPRWEKTVLPAEGYLLMAAVQKDQQCGRNLPYLYHLPLGMITPGGTFQSNTYSLNGNGSTVVVPEGQIRAGYVYNNSPYDVRLATLDQNSALMAQFIILSRDEDASGNYLVQSDSMYTFKSGHNYIPGYTYYLGQDGQPTTDSSFVNGRRQKLFSVIDRMTIVINIQEETE